MSVIETHTTPPSYAISSVRRLDRTCLSGLPAGIRRPRFDPAKLRSGILHLGCGAFHRAHQALVTQRAIEAEGDAGLRWGISSASLVRRTTPDALAPQQGLYTLIERSAEGCRAEVIGAISEVVHAPSDARGLAARLADPETRIVTLTVTDRGYFLDPASHRLDAGDPAIRADLGAARPATPIGALVRGLALTRDAGHVPPVILCCDNLTANGATLKQAVSDFAALEDDGLAAWIERNVQFPNTMVDRIAPSTGDSDRAEALGLLGVEDAAPVVAEPFLDWVIEEFDGPRPRWEEGGATFVSDVEPFEIAKLRLLNGTHMLLAYIGALAGYRTIAEAIQDPLIARLAERFMRSEQGPTVPVSRERRDHYIDGLISRLANPAIRHEVGRVGRNGSMKLATRLLEPMRYNLAERRDIPCTILAIAAWIRWFALVDTAGTAVSIQDPNKDEIRRLCRATRENPMLRAETFLDYDEVFGDALPRQEQVASQLAQAISDLHRYDIHEVIAAHLGETILGKRYPD